MRLAAVAFLVGCGRIGFDARADVDARPTSQAFCDQYPTADLCTDFGDGTIANWLEGGVTNGNYAVDTGALVSTIDPLATTTDIGEAYLNHVFGVAGSRIVLGLDIRVDQVGQGDAVIGQVQFSGTQRHGIEYVYRADASYVEEFRGNMFDPYPVPGPSLSPGEVHRIEMDMDLRATPHMIVRQDGGIVLDTDLIGNVTGTMRASVGLVYLRGPSTSWVLATDNVVVDIE